jgi:hypothetical protein
MLDASSQFALSLFAFMAFFVLVISRAGHHFGGPGATLAVLALWVALTTAVYFDSHDLIPGWRGFLASSFFTGTPLIVFIFLPMLFTFGGQWLRSRLVVGLIGAAVFAWLLTPNVISR